MKPNYKKASDSAIDAFIKYGTDPLNILNQFPNVRVFPFGLEQAVGENCEAFTLVREKDSSLQYIVLYNSSLPQFVLNRALARELAHVILQHDGSSDEEVWSEESNCFAYQFMTLCQEKKAINYRPVRSSLLWEMKSIQVFDSIETLKLFIADECNKFNKYIGKVSAYEAEDVELLCNLDYDKLTGWKNCHDVVVGGNKVGFCGE